MGFIISPFLSPFAFGFLVARARSANPHCLGTGLTLLIVGAGPMELVQFTVLLCCY